MRRPFGSRTCRRRTPTAARSEFKVATAECGELAAAHIADVIDEDGRGKVAAVLMEPNAGTNGIVAPDSFWPALREVDPRARASTSSPTKS